MRPPQGNGNGARSRDSYADVGTAARLSWDRALAAGATPAEFVVLGAIHYFLVTWSRREDWRSLAQIATKAGLWTGDGELPEWIRKRLVGRIRRLVEYGAIGYEPGGAHGRGSASRFVLPGEKGGALSAPPSANRKGEQSALRRGSNPRSEGGAIPGPEGGALSAPPREEACEYEVRERPTRTGAPPVDNGSAARLAAAPPAVDLDIDVDQDDDVILDNLLEAISDHLDELDESEQDYRRAIVTEAQTIAFHVRDHLPHDVVSDIDEKLAIAKLDNPRRALDLARTIAKRHGTTMPRLDLPERPTRTGAR